MENRKLKVTLEVLNLNGVTAEFPEIKEFRERSKKIYQWMR